MILYQYAKKLGIHILDLNVYISNRDLLKSTIEPVKLCPG
jgi:hypothetical protein